ncbi:BnaCnng10460D [Brassica napus]|uniref:(rape) hypothetical protein n=1 Tax=Brassica napus TaxID=3708 RepID=A0A078HRZ7_BRANA|nr:unnamed protein product [Brassica napus]CDY41410.1 BnaCnng10460D [Brassica napus]
MGKGKNHKWKPSQATLLANEEKGLFNEALVKAKYLAGKVLHPNYELNERQKGKGFLAFLDFENTFYDVDDKYEFYPLKNLMEKALKKLDAEYSLEEYRKI